jgi:hypothetical protein
MEKRHAWKANRHISSVVMGLREVSVFLGFGFGFGFVYLYRFVLCINCG